MDEIVEHLYISDWVVSNDIEQLKKNNIRAVLTIETTPKPDYIIKYYRDNNIDFMYLPLYDHPEQNIHQYFNTSFNFIQKHVKNGENVLVHCWAGVSRSATLVFHYLVRNYYQINTRNIHNPCYVVNNFLSYMRTRRNIINPNNGFIIQILKASQYYDIMSSKTR
jgi:protein-tyrosine phosphatase